MTKGKGSVVPVIILALAMILLYSFGCYSLYLLFMDPVVASVIDTINLALASALPILAGYSWILIAFILLIVVLGFVLALGVLLLMRRAASGVLKVLWILQAIVNIALGVIIFIFLLPFGLLALVGLLFPFMGVIQLLIWFRRRRKIERAGKLVEFTASLLLQEKQMFLVPLVIAIFSIFTGILMVATYIAAYAYLPVIFPTIDFASELGSWIFLGIQILMEIPYVFVYFSVFYVFDGVNVSIAHTWWRKEDPNLRGALGEVRSVAGTIIAFAGVTTLVAVAISAVRRSGRKQGGILAIVGVILARIIGMIYRFITYFTLPAIIIEKRGLKDSIVRSAKTTWKYMVDVYIAETGVKTTFSFFGGLLSLGYLVAGFAFGFILGFLFNPTDTLGLIILGIVFAVIFLIFAAIPSYFVFRPLNTAYNTFMFCYALDEESRFKLPSRLPKEYRDVIEAAQAEFEASGKGRRMEEPPSEW